MRAAQMPKSQMPTDAAESLERGIRCSRSAPRALRARAPCSAGLRSLLTGAHGEQAREAD